MPPRHASDDQKLYIPTDDDVDPHAEEIMQLGKVEEAENNDLRDPYFFTRSGLQFLQDRGEL